MLIIAQCQRICAESAGWWEGGWGSRYSYSSTSLCITPIYSQWRVIRIFRWGNWTVMAKGQITVPASRVWNRKESQTLFTNNFPLKLKRVFWKLEKVISLLASSCSVCTHRGQTQVQRPYQFFQISSSVHRRTGYQVCLLVSMQIRSLIGFSVCLGAHAVVLLKHANRSMYGGTVPYCKLDRRKNNNSSSHYKKLISWKLPNKLYLDATCVSNCKLKKKVLLWL